MALRVISGVPGAGKSYYAVTHIISKYCVPFGDVYHLKKNYIIVTNIEGLLLPTIDLAAAVKKSGSIEQFFTQAVQKKVTEKYQSEGKKVVYIIDEAQQFFHRRFYDRDVFSFFESHRHYGLDIYLLTQNSNLLPKDLIALVEIEIRAVPRTLSIAGFNYLRKSNKDIIGREFLRKKRNIFAMYKSMSGEETEKIKTPYLKYCIPVVILFALGFYLLSGSFFGRAIKRKVGVDVGPGSVIAATSANVKNTKLPGRSKKTNTDVIVFDTELNFIRHGKDIRVLNPRTNKIVPILLYPYPVKATISGSKLRLYSSIPSLETEKEEN